MNPLGAIVVEETWPKSGGCVASFLYWKNSNQASDAASLTPGPVARSRGKTFFFSGNFAVLNFIRHV
jgi:hypothetical protein